MINLQYSYEIAILSSSLYAESFGFKQITLDTSVFLNPFNKRVAELINERIIENRSVYALIDFIEGKLNNDSQRMTYLDILAATPLSSDETRRLINELKLMKLGREI